MSRGRWIIERGGRRLMEVRAGVAALRVGAGPDDDIMLVGDPDVPHAELFVVGPGEARARVTADGRGEVALRPGEPLELGSYRVHYDAPAPVAGASTRLIEQGGARAEPLLLELPSGSARLEADRPYTLGRDPSNDLVVDADVVSSFHCELSPAAGGWQLRDLGSSNGTFLGGARVTQVGLPRQGRVRLGDLDLGFRSGGLDPQEDFHGMVGQSSAMQAVYRQIEVMAKLDEPVLVLGETGTGKELAATALHVLSGRRPDRLVVRNCGAIPEALAESELFGSRSGAFSGAVDKPGVFEGADGGTVFLDEVGELPPSVQPKLLRAIQERRVQRLGELAEVAVDFRLVAATHRDLPRLVEEGCFREDLYHRLGVFTVRLPPLRERPEDIPRLASHLLEGAGVELSSGAAQRLVEHGWPGNVRELRNCLIRASAFRTGDRIEADDLVIAPQRGGASASPKPPPRPGRRATSLDDEAIRAETLRVWEESGRSVSRAAARLGIAKSTMHRRKAIYGLPEPEPPN